MPIILTPLLPICPQRLNAIQRKRADDHLVLKSALLAFLLLFQPLDCVALHCLAVQHELHSARLHKDHFQVHLAVVLHKRRACNPLSPCARAELEVVSVLALRLQTPPHHVLVGVAVRVAKAHNSRAHHALRHAPLHRVLLAALQLDFRQRIHANKRAARNVSKHLSNRFLVHLQLSVALLTSI